jgi:hypothetical protein
MPLVSSGGRSAHQQPETTQTLGNKNSEQRGGFATPLGSNDCKNPEKAAHKAKAQLEASSDPKSEAEPKAALGGGGGGGPSSSSSSSSSTDKEERKRILACETKWVDEKESTSKVGRREVESNLGER